MKNSINKYPPTCGKSSHQVASSAKHTFIFSLMLMLFQNATFMAQAQTDPPNGLAPGFGNTLTDDSSSAFWIANNFLRIDPLASGTASSFTASLGSGTFTLRVGENYGSLSSTTDVRALFYGGNVGLVHSGSFGNGTSASSKWQGIGERIPISGTPGTNFYGMRNQWGVYASNFGSRDRSSGSQTDAIVTWQDGSYSTVSSSDTATNRLIFTSVVADNSFNIIERELGTMLGNGNFGLGINNPQYQMDMFGAEGKARLRIRTGTTGDGFLMGYTGSNFIFNNTQNGNLNFVTNGSLRMAVTGTGIVRIGVATQTGSMEIVNTQNDTNVSLMNLTDLNTNFLYVRSDGFVGVGTKSPIIPTGSFSSLPIMAMGPNFSNIKLSIDGDFTQDGGDIVTSGDIYAISDTSFKYNIRPIGNEWKKILQISSITYKLKNDKLNIKFNNVIKYGFNAQNIFSIFPELTKNWGASMVVNYSAFIPILTEGIKEHEQRIEILEDKLRSYEERIVELETLKVKLSSLQDTLDNLINNYDIIPITAIK